MKKDFLDQVKKDIDRAKVISFDIFDTLLLRPYVRPFDLFMHLEKITGVRGFCVRRCLAENDFKSANPAVREVTYDNIYDILGRDFAGLKQPELDLEYRVLTRNPEIASVYDYAKSLGKDIIIASDMYLPLDFIKKVLAKNGFDGYKKLYLSNDIDRRKDRGDMYDYIVDDLGVAASDIFHIGDNKHSDVKRAKKHGLGAMHYPMVVKRYLRNNPRAKQYWWNTMSVGASIVTAMNAWRHLRGDFGKNYWRDFGYEYAGPAAYAFARFIESNAKSNNINTLFFVARDGYLLDKVFKTFNTDVASHYVYAPRILNYVTNLDYDRKSPEQSKIVFDHFAEHHPEFHQIADVANAQRIPYHVILAQNHDLVVKLATMEKEWAGYDGYIKSKLVNPNDNVGVIDTISLRMSGQKLIENALQKQTTGFYWATINSNNGWRAMTHIDFFPGGAETTNYFLSNGRPDIVEFIFTSPEPPIRYFKDGGPVHAENIQLPERIRGEIYPDISAFAIEFAKDIKSVFGNNDIYLTDTDMFKLLDLFMSEPTSRDIREMMVVRKSIHANHAKYIPMFSAKVPLWRVNRLKRLQWRTRMQNLVVCLAYPIKVTVKFPKRIEFYLLPRLRNRYFTLSVAPTKKFRWQISVGAID